MQLLQTADVQALDEARDLLLEVGDRQYLAVGAGKGNVSLSHHVQHDGVQPPLGHVVEDLAQELVSIAAHCAHLALARAADQAARTGMLINTTTVNYHTESST